MGRTELADDEHGCVYVEIGASAGPRAQLPADLLRSTEIIVRGSGAGSSKIEEIMTELPIMMSKIADGTITVPVFPYRLRDVAKAWGSDHPGERVVLVA